MCLRNSSYVLNVTLESVILKNLECKWRQAKFGPVSLPISKSIFLKFFKNRRQLCHVEAAATTFQKRFKNICKNTKKVELLEMTLYYHSSLKIGPIENPEK